MINKEEKAKVVAAAWGTELTQFLAALAVLHQDVGRKGLIEEWTLGGMDALCFGKMDDQPVHTTPYHHPTKITVHLKTFLQIILPAKWLMQHSSTSPNHHQCIYPSSMLIGTLHASCFLSASSLIFKHFPSLLLQPYFEIEVQICLYV